LFYPEGREEVVADRIGPHFTVYRIEREELARARMLHAVFTAPDGKRLERAESNLGTVGARGTAESWIAPEGLVYPSRASWEGAFLTPEAGIQTGTLAGGGDAELWIDGRLVARESGLPGSAKPVALPLARGLHGVRLDGTLTAVTSRILVRLSVPIPARMLFRRALGAPSGAIWRG